jgi:predicted RNA-binding Zn ribbon-like protein
VDSEAQRGVALAVELVNTRPRPASPDDELPDPALRPARDALLAAFGAPDTAAFVAAVNPLLAAPVAETGPGGEVVLRAPSLPALAAHGLATLVAERGLHRIGFCAADDCQAVFADTSPRGARRYCSRTCSTRENVRRHRRVSGGDGE